MSQQRKAHAEPRVPPRLQSPERVPALPDLGPVGRMQYAETVAAARPYQQQGVFALRHAGELTANIFAVSSLVPINLEDHVATREPRIIGRATGLDLCDDGSVDVARHTKLVSHVRRQIAQANAPFPPAVLAR